MTAQDLVALPSPKRREISRKAVGIPPKGRRSQNDEVDDNAILHLLFRTALYLYYAIATFVKYMEFTKNQTTVASESQDRRKRRVCQDQLPDFGELGICSS
jgi:hypothetical protein